MTLKKATMKDVAQLADVSVSSVSRYVNDPSSINPIPALKIEKAIRELGYVPNPFAQALKGGDNRTVGVVLPGIGPFFSSVAAALSDFFYQHKYLLYICETGEDPEKEQYYVNALIGQRVAGILIALSGKTSDFVSEVSLQFPNIVMIDQHDEGCPVDAVYEDSLESSYQLTKYMIKRGHRQFILLFRTEFSTNTPQRILGTQRAFEEAGLNLNNMYVHFDIRTEHQLYDCLSGGLQKTPRPTAVIGYSPLIMENAMISLNRLNISVPNEIDLAGYTLEDFSSKFRFEIPSAVQKPYDLGIHAGDMLLRKLRRRAEKNAPKQFCLSMELRLPQTGLRSQWSAH